MAVKIIALIKRKPGLSAQEFREYYETRHAPLALKHLGRYIQKYVRNYPIAGDTQQETEYFRGGKPAEDAFDYDVLTEMWFADRATYDELCTLTQKDPVIGEIFRTDEGRFIDRPSVRYIVCDECMSGGS
jgi:hypothetical protein